MNSALTNRRQTVAGKGTAPLRSQQLREEMNKRSRTKSWQDVLCYRFTKASQSTVKRYYDQWRHEHGLPRRCDNPDCTYYSSPLVWNNRPLPLILDHVEGNRRDNRPEMLRYLCPNCDSQLLTRGGQNIGRVIQATENGFMLISPEKTRHYTFFPSGGVVLGGSVELSFSKVDKINE